MYKFDIAEKIKDNILNKIWKPNPVIVYDEINSSIANFLVEEKLSKEKLDRLEKKYVDIPFAKDDNDRGQNRWKYDRHYPEVIELLEQFNEIDNSDYRCSGIFWYPNTGYCGWHTNSTNCDKRIYLVWSEEDNKSFFRWKDKYTNKIHTKWEKKGWNVNIFTAPVWHCIGSHTNRISIGLQHTIPEEVRFLKGNHICNKDSKYGDWRFISKDNTKLNLQLIRYLLTPDKLKTINHDEICWKGMDNIEDEQFGKRYEKADIIYPCILIEDAPNPKNMKYRMIDGKHRMAKMKSKNINKSSFYVLNVDEVKEYFEQDNREYE